MVCPTKGCRSAEYFWRTYIMDFSSASQLLTAEQFWISFLCLFGSQERSQGPDADTKTEAPSMNAGLAGVRGIDIAFYLQWRHGRPLIQIIHASIFRHTQLRWPGRLLLPSSHGKPFHDLSPISFLPAVTLWSLLLPSLSLPSWLSPLHAVWILSGSSCPGG